MSEQNNKNKKGGLVVGLLILSSFFYSWGQSSPITTEKISATNETTKISSASSSTAGLAETQKKLNEKFEGYASNLIKLEEMSVQSTQSTQSTQSQSSITTTKVENKTCQFENKQILDAIIQASQEYNIDCRYLLTIGYTENISNPNAIGDNGCSFGIYQINICVHKTTNLNPSIMDCAKDYLCSSRWTAQRIRDIYCQSTTCDSWIIQLSKHNGFVGVPTWYYNKIEKNGIKAGLKF